MDETALQLGAVQENWMQGSIHLGRIVDLSGSQKMNKIATLGLEKERTRLMESLMEMGVVQISESTVDEESPGITIPQTILSLPAWIICSVNYRPHWRFLGVMFR